MSNYVCYNEFDVMYLTGVINKVSRSFVRSLKLFRDNFELLFSNSVV